MGLVRKLIGFVNLDAIWQMNLGSDETMGGDGSYPERPGEPDCTYYVRTGLCRFGSTCRFNHPHDRKLVLIPFLCFCSISDNILLLYYLAFPLFLVGSKYVAMSFGFVCVCDY